MDSSPLPAQPPGPYPGRIRIPASLPAPAPGPVTVALTEFWAGRRADVPPVAAVGAAVVGVAGGWVLVGHRPGLGAALLGLAVWVPALPRLLRDRRAGDLVTVGLSIALVSVVAVRDAGWLVALCLVAAALLAMAASAGARTALALLLAPLTWAVGAVRTLPWLARGAAHAAGGRRDQVRRALVATGLTTLVVVVFGALFASADRVFATLLDVDLGLLPARAVVGGVVALAALVLVGLAVARPSWDAVRLRPAAAAPRPVWLAPVLALDLVVVAFLVVQLVAAVGGHEYVQRTAGLSYAEYAREGFGQLLAATVLTLVVLAVAVRHAPRTTRADVVLTRAALAVLCLATTGVVVSALRRMDLYVEAYGLTRLRLVAVAVEVALGVVLLLVLVAGLRRHAPWLPRAVAWTLGVALLGLAAVDPDALVVRHNTGPTVHAPLDTTYLQNLSADAVPAVAALPDAELRRCLLAGFEVPADGPVEWNLGRDRARAALRSGPRPGPVDASADRTGADRTGGGCAG